MNIQLQFQKKSPKNIMKNITSVTEKKYRHNNNKIVNYRGYQNLDQN